MTDESHYLEFAGQTVTIRPMSHGDADMEQDLVRRLSPESKHYRFVGVVRELTPKEVRRFCDLDGHRSFLDFMPAHPPSRWAPYTFCCRR